MQKIFSINGIKPGIFFRTTAITFAFLLVASTASADTNSRLRITKYDINNENEIAELCLTSSHPVDISNRTAILDNITFEQGDKRLKISPEDLSLTTSQICIQKLQRKRPYKITINNVPNTAGLELKNPVELEFTIPNRKPKLSFIQTPTSQGTMPFMHSPKLEAVNIKDVKITIYHINRPETYAQAWRQYEQSNIVPSESLTFARENGVDFWQSDLALSEAPNQTQSIDVPLPDTPSGLYFVTAAPLTAPSGIKADPNLVAGIWLVKSNLRMVPQITKTGMTIFANAKSAVVPNVVIQMLNKDNSVTGEGLTGTDGTAELPLPQANTPSLVIGTTKSGEVAFLPVSSAQPATENIAATITTDRELYSPGDGIAAMASATDNNGQTAKLERSTLRLIKPDQTQEAERLLKSDNATSFVEIFQLPASCPTGDWSLVWQNADGSYISQSKIKVRNKEEGAEARLTADRGYLEPGEEIGLNIKITGENTAYRAGSIDINPERLNFPAWPGYTFGLTPDLISHPSRNSFDFMTSADGTARLRMPAQQMNAGAMKLRLSVKGSSLTDEILLPFSSANGWVGIKQIPGNTPDEIMFNVIAVDSNLKRRTGGEVFYQIFEEGRNFEWFQSEGRWEYRPLPNHHRVTGGHLSLFSNSDNTISWAANPGNYIVEISKSDGTVLARQNIHHTAEANNTESNDFLALSYGKEKFTPGKQNSLTLSLKHPAAVSVAISDGKNRQVIRHTMPSGDTPVNFVPPPTWGNNITVQALAFFSTSGNDIKIAMRNITVPLAHPEHELSVKLETKPRILTGKDLSIPITIQNIKDQQATFVNAVVTPIVSRTSGYISDAETSKMERIAVNKDGKATLNLSVPEFAGSLQILVHAWNSTQSGSSASVFQATPSILVKSDIPSSMLEGESRQVKLTLINRAAPAGEYSYKITSPGGTTLSGVKSGTVVIRRGQAQPWYFKLKADTPLYGSFKVEITGPENFRFTHVQPIRILWSPKRKASSIDTLQVEPKQFQALKPSPAAGEAGEKDSITYFPKTVVAPINPAALLAGLRRLLVFEPFTTTEISNWVKASRLWQGQLESSGVYIGELFNDLRYERIRRVIKRQNADGSFSAWPDKSSGDIMSTSAAIIALNEESNKTSLIETTKSRALNWLQYKLENTWFEESERNGRAAGFLALARMGQSDLPDLNYYADTSKDKEMSPLACAQLGLAFAFNHDEKAARYWLGRIPSDAIEEDIKDEPRRWDILSALAENPFSDWDEISSLVSAASAQEASPNPLPLLNSLWALGQRAGTWQVSLNGTTRKYQGFKFMSEGEESSSITLQNLYDKKLFISRQEAPEITQSYKPAGVEQYFYLTDGGRLGEGTALKQGDVYVSEISGPYLSGTMPTIVQIQSGKDLQPIIAEGMSAEALSNLFGWLENNLTPWMNASYNETTATFIIQPPSENAKNSRWKIAYPVKAETSGAPVISLITTRLSEAR